MIVLRMVSEESEIKKKHTDKSTKKVVQATRTDSVKG